MKHFNKFNKQLRPEDQELPAGFNWEEMSDGIFDKMENQNHSNQKSKASILKRILLFISIILGAVFISVLFIQKEDISKDTNSSYNSTLNNQSKFTEDKEQKKAKLNKDLSSDQQINANHVQENFIHSNKDKTESQEIKQEVRDATYSSNESSNINGKTNFDISSEPNNKDSNRNHINSSTSNPNTNSNLGHVPNENLVATLDADKNKELNIQNIQPKKTTETNSISLRSEISVSTLESVGLDFLQHTQEFITFPNPKLTPSIDPMLVKSWTVDVGTGWNTWGVGFDNSRNENDFYNSTSLDYGFSFSLRGSKRIHEKVRLSSGIDIDYLYKKLHYTETFLNPNQKEDAFVGVIINPISGKHSDVFRDTIIIDTLIRTTTNYNRYQVISIPLIVNYNIWNKNSWKVDLGLGPTLSLLNTYSGKYVKDDFLEDYTTDSNIYSRSPKIALNLSLSFRKNLFHDYYLGLRMDYKNHLMNWGQSEEAVTKPKIVSGLITLGKQF